MKSMLIDVHTLLVLYLTIPMTTATAEFGISTLRRIKMYLNFDDPAKAVPLHAVTHSCMN